MCGVPVPFTYTAIQKGDLAKIEETMFDLRMPVWFQSECFIMNVIFDYH